MLKKDVRIHENDYIFKYRVCGAVVVDNKLLTVKIMDNDFYCLPGGHVAQKELANDAIIREIKEEVSCDVLKKTLFAICENIFEGKNSKTVQEIGMYYFIKPSSDINLEDRIFIELDDGINKRLEFKWVDLDDLDNINFKPKFLVEQIKNMDRNLKYYSYKK